MRLRQPRRWRLHLRIGQSTTDLARAINPLVRGWTHGAFYRSAMHTLLRRINAYLLRWIRKKYRRLRGYRKAKAAWQRVRSQYPRLFAHWAWVPTRDPPAIHESRLTPRAERGELTLATDNPDSTAIKTYSRNVAMLILVR